MKKVGEGIALGTLIIACVLLELFGHGAGYLWGLVGVWSLFF